MNKKTNRILLIIFAAILIIFGIWYLSTIPEQYFDKVELSTKNGIKNQTEYNYLDTLVSVGIEQLNISPVFVVIKSLTEQSKNNFLFENDKELKAYIIGNNSQYMLFVDKMYRVDAITVISHELIHLKQYNSGVLKIDSTKVIWWSDTIKSDELTKWTYGQRPWEIDARKKSILLSDEIRKILYKSKY